jgi:acyl-CoA reductase-like NAD-dependent aldehyde dehydrogenase
MTTGITVPRDSRPGDAPGARAFGLFIDGGEQPAQGGATFPGVNPSTGGVFAQYARGAAPDVDRAVRAAQRAFGEVWRRTTPRDRGRILLQMHRLLQDQAVEFVRAESLDTGKPLRQAQGDVAIAIRYFEYYAGLAPALYGETIPLSPDVLDFTVREPAGVCGLIIPWNFPLMIAARGIATALAAGNTVVLKPAEDASLTALLLAQLVRDSALPPGALNVVTGFGPEAGAALAAHPGVSLLSFTGSVATGTKVAAAAAQNVVPAILELGGKSPIVVFADADLETVAGAVVESFTEMAGQSCDAGTRLLVEEPVRDALVDRIVQRCAELKIGPGLDDPDIGPIINERQFRRVMSYIESGIAEGARLRCGGHRVQEDRLRGGLYVAPTVFDQVSPGMRIAREEIFGPVLSVLAFRTVDEAVELANGTEYGLSATVWTSDLRHAHRLAREIRAGQVYVNTLGSGDSVAIPFGGFNKSGFGREKSIEGLRSYTRLKNVCIKI